MKQTPQIVPPTIDVILASDVVTCQKGNDIMHLSARFSFFYLGNRKDKGIGDYTKSLQPKATSNFGPFFS